MRYRCIAVWTKPNVSSFYFFAEVIQVLFISIERFAPASVGVVEKCTCVLVSHLCSNVQSGVMPSR